MLCTNNMNAVALYGKRRKVEAMKKAKKALALVLTAALALSAVPAQAADRFPALASKKTITAGKKGRAMSVSARKNYKKAGYTLKFASSKPKVATVNEKTGVQDEYYL